MTLAFIQEEEDLKLAVALFQEDQDRKLAVALTQEEQDRLLALKYYSPFVTQILTNNSPHFFCQEQTITKIAELLSLLNLENLL